MPLLYCVDNGSSSFQSAPVHGFYLVWKEPHVDACRRSCCFESLRICVEVKQHLLRLFSPFVKQFDSNYCVTVLCQSHNMVNTVTSYHPYHPVWQVHDMFLQRKRRCIWPKLALQLHGVLWSFSNVKAWRSIDKFCQYEKACNLWCFFVQINVKKSFWCLVFINVKRS